MQCAHFKLFRFNNLTSEFWAKHREKRYLLFIGDLQTCWSHVTQMTWIFHDITRIMSVQNRFHHTSWPESQMEQKRRSVIPATGMTFKISTLFSFKFGLGLREQWKDFYWVIYHQYCYQYSPPDDYSLEFCRYRKKKRSVTNELD